MHSGDYLDFTADGDARRKAFRVLFSAFSAAKAEEQPTQMSPESIRRLGKAAENAEIRGKAGAGLPRPNTLPGKKKKILFLFKAGENSFSLNLRRRRTRAGKHSACCFPRFPRL
jgi:hypothetical protein